MDINLSSRSMAAAPTATIGYTVETTRFSRDWDIGAWGKAQRCNEYYNFKRAEISRGSITLYFVTKFLKNTN